MPKRTRSAPTPPLTPGRALEGAIQALQRNRPEEAERLASDALKSNKRDALALQILGRALLMQGRADDAIALLTSATRRVADPMVEVLLAKALAFVGRADEALDQLRAATNREPPLPPAFLELADRLGQGGHLEEAVTVLERGLALAAENVDLKLALGHLYFRQNRRSEARACFSQAYESAPERHDATVALAAVMVADGEYSNAAMLYRRALGLRPDDAASRINLGKCLLELGDRDAGEAALRAAVRNAPQLAGYAITALAATPHGRMFLRPSAATKLLGIEKNADR